MHIYLQGVQHARTLAQCNLSHLHRSRHPSAEVVSAVTCRHCCVCPSLPHSVFRVPGGRQTRRCLCARLRALSHCEPNGLSCTHRALRRSLMHGSFACCPGYLRARRRHTRQSGATAGIPRVRHARHAITTRRQARSVPPAGIPACRDSMRTVRSGPGVAFTTRRVGCRPLFSCKRARCPWDSPVCVRSLWLLAALSPSVLCGVGSLFEPVGSSKRDASVGVSRPNAHCTPWRGCHGAPRMP